MILGDEFEPGPLVWQYGGVPSQSRWRIRFEDGGQALASWGASFGWTAKVTRSSKKHSSGRAPRGIQQPSFLRGEFPNSSERVSRPHRRQRIHRVAKVIEDELCHERVQHAVVGVTRQEVCVREVAKPIHRCTRASSRPARPGRDITSQRKKTGASGGPGRSRHALSADQNWFNLGGASQCGREKAKEDHEEETPAGEDVRGAAPPSPTHCGPKGQQQCERYAYSPFLPFLPLLLLLPFFFRRASSSSFACRRCLRIAASAFCRSAMCFSKTGARTRPDESFEWAR